MCERADHRAEADERPWEEPGSCRMDCAPHRGPLLMLLGTASLIGGLSAVLVLPVVIGLPLGVATWVVAERDLKKMGAGLLDPNGRPPPEWASSLGFLAAVLSLFCPLLGLCCLNLRLP